MKYGNGTFPPKPTAGRTGTDNPTVPVIRPHGNCGPIPTRQGVRYVVACQPPQDEREARGVVRALDTLDPVVTPPSSYLCYGNTGASESHGDAGLVS